MESIQQDIERKLAETELEAIIFDMDGVLVDSEPFWSQAEKEVFTSLGVTLTRSLCQQTSRMTTRQVSEFWYARSPWGDEVSIADTEKMVIDKVKSLITTEECEIPGIRQFIHKLKNAGLKVGLSTNAPYEFIPQVLKKVGVEGCFDTTCSSEHETHGKPAPDVYLSVLKQLSVDASEALAIEDSNSGIRAAKSAGIKTAAFTNNGQNEITESVDLVITNFTTVNPRLILNL